MNLCDGFEHPTRSWMCRNCHISMESKTAPARECSRAYELKRRRDLGLDAKKVLEFPSSAEHPTGDTQ